jgi:hypothetical protein
VSASSNVNRFTDNQTTDWFIQNLTPFCAKGTAEHLFAALRTNVPEKPAT